MITDYIGSEITEIKIQENKIMNLVYGKRFFIKDVS